ncbi:sam-dependent methyltransferase [Diaporthe amygdali]|uniref:sam-dependent methyltransferase n=1 Tax=Phomopsis amygdali TaxID=1214568 RepID=UPI0022FE4865|nr:sam-dependent methyltransferase [Diaporthe amygdali]KAJ0115575.1 sam-dependent methyltransferase [Diaporthe amygdali]
MATSNTVLSLSSAEKIASYQLLPPNGLVSEAAQAAHRINLLNSWGPDVIKPGSRILEIGCGQGNCTAVLAEAVGPSGHVDAYDPAPPDYGSPFTLAEAQGHISQSEIGNRITWHREKPWQQEVSNPDGEVEPKQEWDVVVLAHCVWYFKQRDELSNIMNLLKSKVRKGGKVCIAEYALHATAKAAWPHVLAALATGTLQALGSEDSSENIQAPLSPEQIKRIARDQDWNLDSDAVLVPKEGLLDGRWEAGSVASEYFSKEVDRVVSGEDWKSIAILKAMRASVLVAVDAIGGVKETRTMDVWTGVFSVDKGQK